jgi:hypothetical protein
MAGFIRFLDRRLAHAVVAAVLASVALTVAPPPPPADAAGNLVPPSTVGATASGSTTIVVTWSATPSTSSYRVLRSSVSGGPYTQLGTTSSLSFTDSGLAAATRYFYVVQSAYNKKLSAYSPEATAATPLPAPAGVRLNATESTMDVQWEPVPGAVRYDILRTGPYETETLIASTTATTYHDGTVVSGSYYGYRIRAMASNGATGSSSPFAAYAGPATTMVLNVWPPKAEPGQWVLVSAEVRNVDGSAPAGPVDFYLNGSWLDQVDLGGEGRAERVVQMGTASLTFTAQYQGYNGGAAPVAGASGSGPVGSVAYPAYGYVSLQPAQAHPVQGRAIAVTAGDLTGDGLNDVVVTTDQTVDQSYERGFEVFVQQPDHTLGAPQYHAMSPTGGGSTPTIADVNGDGHADLLITSGDGVDVYLQTAQGLAAPTPVSFGTSVTAARLLDLDRDGIPDLVVDGDAGTLVRYGTGAGNFEPPVNLFPYFGELVVADLAGDGRPDLAVLRDHVVSVLTQLAPRQFADPVGYEVPPDRWGPVGSFAAGDVTGDGHADIVIAVGSNTPTGRLEVLTRSADGNLGTWLVYSSYDNPTDVLLADMNGDGLLDVLSTHMGFPGVGMMLQRPDGWLGVQTIYHPYSASDYTRYGLAVGDITGDGRPDLLLADQWDGLVTRVQ